MHRREIKLGAKNIIKNRGMGILWVAAIFILLQFVVSFFINELSGYNNYYSYIAMTLGTHMTRLESAVSPEEMQAVLESIELPGYEHFIPETFSIILAVVMYLTNVLLTAGFQFHSLMESRGYPARAKALFFPFNIAHKVLAIQLLTGILVAVGTVFFILPGIVLYLKYSMALFVLFDDPRKGPVRCMKESGKMMRGNKRRYLIFDLSFLLWEFASSFVTLILQAPVLDVWVLPYLNMSRGIFYTEISGWKRPERAPEPEPEA